MKDQNNIHNDQYLAQWIEGLISDSELKKLVSEEEFTTLFNMREKLNTYIELQQPLDSIFDSIKNKIGLKSKPRKVKWNWALAIAAIIVLCLSLVTLLNPNDRVFETGFGEQKLIALADGTEVILNAKSSITYNESDWEEERTLNLVGEAYFKVKKGSTFTVNTQRGSVEVLGTEFNVNVKDELLEVVCYEGSVLVSQYGKKTTLKSNDNIRKVNGNNIETWTSSLSRPNWVDGESTYKSMPLKYVILALENQYNIKFETDLIDNSMLFSGSFTHTNLEIALQTVFGALEIHYYEKEKNVVTLTSN
ncbi:FecR family protein [Ichthyenterobacterium sp. W332]|uniref:FecR family protein n=1 Tax=Microcosmobacter mediterraneus TaxID=3075607 RepID=A0ABU2YG11_9FLAO|nr:FecR family protein [Ichthyenterobacterium sp. W332]MDT0557124.1 FecR family protein [Ichthyenterobacterium sp. W332]